MIQPIIIIGAARSGTKYLRDILATAPNTRKIPYDVPYIWRYGNENHSDDSLPPGLATPSVAAFVQQSLLRLAKAPNEENTVVIEKTVGNSLRVPFVDRVWPEAKFVHLIRDGRSVTESAMRNWQASPDWKRLFTKLQAMPLSNIGYVARFAANYVSGLRSGRGGGQTWGPRYPGIDQDVANGKSLTELCAKQWAESVRHSIAGLATIAPERQITIRYEELTSDERHLRAVCAFCGLEDIEGILAHHAVLVDRKTNDKWRSLSDTQIAAMAEIIDPLQHQLGYEGTSQ